MAISRQVELSPAAIAAPLGSLLICARFGIRLRELRQSRSETQAELARRLNIDRAFVSDLERGKKNVSIPYLHLLATGFDLTLSEMLAGL